MTYEEFNQEVVILDCTILTGYSHMCSAWKDVIGRWYLPKSVFHAYHEITGYNQSVREQAQAWCEGKR